ncbi:MAG TPA: LytTR family DNA-binding domain-containing protein [Bacteroidia bacterium]|nr:LytTR family DNA-binding domain-containing protein [Bacteroidia bacterium]
MKVIIIDDEKKARQLLQVILSENHPEVTVCDLCEDLASGVRAIKKHQPNLVFLDIEMPGYSGLELLDFFNEDELNFSIVFVTAYNEYAIQAFKLSAIDYILKPINPQFISEAIEKYKKQEYKQLKLIEALKQNLSVEEDKKIAIPSRDSITYINPKNILFIKADGAYSMFYLSNGQKHMLSRNLKYVEEMLSHFPYIKRCHKSYIVNTKEIKSYNRSKSLLVLAENIDVPVTEDRVSEVLEQ